MEKLIEFYEMVSLNEAALSISERRALLTALRARDVFASAMERFRLGSAATRFSFDAGRRMAA